VWCRATPTTVLGSAWHGPSSVAISLPFLRQRLNLGLQHEDAIEMYYNIAVHTLAQRYGRPSDHQPRAKEGYQTNLASSHVSIPQP